MRLIPLRKQRTLKLINRPTLIPLRRMYERSWGFVNRVKRIDGFDLDNDAMFND